MGLFIVFIIAYVYMETRSKEWIKKSPYVDLNGGAARVNKKGMKRILERHTK